MDAATIETRARIACRICLMLFDAGDGFAGTAGGALVEFDKMDPQHGSGTPDHVLVRDVLGSLERANAIYRGDGSRPLWYSLDQNVRSMMSTRWAVHRDGTGAATFADRVREELTWFDSGNDSDPPTVFTMLDPVVRALRPTAGPI